jgi:hypothetical protein
MDNNIYSIIDLDGYAASIRDFAAKSFLENYEENLDDYISVEQVKSIIIGYSLGQDDEFNYLLNEEVFNDTFEDVREWIFNVGVAKLASKGLVECAWDDESNEMVFWCKDDEQTKPTNNGT